MYLVQAGYGYFQKTLNNRRVRPVDGREIGSDIAKGKRSGLDRCEFAVIGVGFVFACINT